jgi:hypothetical protein
MKSAAHAEKLDPVPRTGVRGTRKYRGGLIEKPEGFRHPAFSDIDCAEIDKQRCRIRTFAEPALLKRLEGGDEFRLRLRQFAHGGE